MSSTTPEVAPSPGWRRPAVAVLVVLTAALSFGLATGAIAPPSFLVRGAAGPDGGTTLVPAPTPSPSPIQGVAAPVFIQPVSSASGAGLGTSPGGPGGQPSEEPSPTPEPTPTPTPQPPAVRPVSDVVDPVVHEVTTSADDLTGGATKPVTGTLDELVDVVTDALDPVVAQSGLLDALGGTP